MKFLDFHHHKRGITNGIYNLHFEENIPDFPFSIGIHPKDIDAQWTQHFGIVEQYALDKNCFAIGECGLDGLVPVDCKLQEEVFQRHISLANTIRKPIIIHCVRLHAQLLKFRKVAQTPMIVHGFNKKATIGNTLLDHGFYLSFGKAVLQNVSLQNFVKDCPLNQLFLETDDADFDIKDLYETVATLKGISVEQLYLCIIDNLERIRNI